MLLRRLQLSNFRQYEKLDISFRDGIIGVVGPNGSGKSTILEAILWCLFGNRAARTSREGIKRQTARQNDDLMVELDFEISGIEYSLERSLIGKSSRAEARLKKAGSLDAVSIREVDSYVTRLIGLDLKGFLSSFFARQRELNVLTDARPAERRDHLARMLGVGRLDTAIEILKDDIKSVRQRIDILSGLLIDPDEVSPRLERKRAETGDLRKSREAKSADLERLEKEVKSKDGEVLSLRQKEQAFNRAEKELSINETREKASGQRAGRLEKEIAELDRVEDRAAFLKPEIENIEDLRNQLDRLKKAENLSSEKKRLETERTRLSANIDSQRSEKARLEQEMERCRKEIKGKEDLTTARSEREAEIEALRNQYREMSGDSKIIASDLARLEKQKKEIGSLGPDAVCEMCLRPFGKELPEIESHFDREILSLRHRREPLETKLKEIDRAGKEIGLKMEETKKELEKLNIVERDLATAETSFKAISTGIVENQNSIKEIEKRLAEVGEVSFSADQLVSLEKELAQKQKDREEYIRLAERMARRGTLQQDLKQAREELETAGTRCRELEAEITAIGFDSRFYQNARDELSQMQERVSTVRIDIERTDGKVALLEAESKSLMDQLESFEKSKKEISQLREKLTLLEKLSLLFADFRKYLIGRIRPALSKTTSELFYEMTDGRYQEVELDEDYNLRLFDNGQPFPVTRFSGGEIDLANLCFRLAISIEMARTAGIDQSFIILDEIFGSQDRQRQQLIIEGLNRLKERFRQIFIISHIEEVKEMAEHLMIVRRDETGISRVEMAGVA